ncbi:MAG: TetR/AcrR family transcriptional regulator [Anaerolineaceae bacterium]|nr:TetR/AcrR family transcriptional regulator [Anaerolineaceae bacterium]
MTEHESKAHILATALAVFAEKGFARASMNDVVRTSGLSKGGVYWHFKSKDDLITAIFDHFFVEQLAQLDEMLAGEGTAVTKLMQLASQTGQSVAAMASQFPTPLEFYALASREAGLQTLLQTHFQSYETKIAALVAQGISNGEFRSVDSQATAKTIVALFEGVLLIWAISPDLVDLGTQVETAVQLLLQGLQTT